MPAQSYLVTILNAKIEPSSFSMIDISRLYNYIYINPASVLFFPLF